MLENVKNVEEPRENRLNFKKTLKLTKNRD